MDLFVRVLLLILVLVVIVMIGYYTLQSTISQHVTKQQAESLLTANLQRTYPGGLINITNDTPSSYAGSWHIAASVILNASTPCPAYYVYTFDYPQFGFVSRVVSTYTKGCVIYGFVQNKSFIVSSFPVAITKAYMLGIPSVTNFINAKGFNNVVVSAHYYNATAIQGVNYTKVWQVRYGTQGAGPAVYVILSLYNGTLVKTYNSSS